MQHYLMRAQPVSFPPHPRVAARKKPLTVPPALTVLPPPPPISKPASTPIPTSIPTPVVKEVKVEKKPIVPPPAVKTPIPAFDEATVVEAFIRVLREITQKEEEPVKTISCPIVAPRKLPPPPSAPVRTPTVLPPKSEVPLKLDFDLSDEDDDEERDGYTISGDGYSGDGDGYDDDGFDGSCDSGCPSHCGKCDKCKKKKRRNELRLP